MQSTEAKLGRIFVLRLHDGDRLPDVIESFAAERNVSAALCFFLGGAKEKSRVVVGPKEGYDFPPEPMVTLLRGVHEACGLGTIFLDEKEKPKLHMPEYSPNDGYWYSSDSSKDKKLVPTNWCETLTEVK